MDRRSALAAAPVVAALVALTAGCGSSSLDVTPTGTAPTRAPLDTATGTPSAPATSSTAAPSSTAVVAATSTPASVPDVPSLVSGRYVTLTGCRAVAGGWRAQGTARATTKAATYTITVSFDAGRAVAQAYGQTRVTVAKGATTTWTVTQTFAASASTVCVLRAAG